MGLGVNGITEMDRKGNACNYRQDTYSHGHATDLATARQADVKDFHRLEHQIVAKQMGHDLQHADHWFSPSSGFLKVDALCGFGIAQRQDSLQQILPPELLQATLQIGLGDIEQGPNGVPVQTLTKQEFHHRLCIKVIGGDMWWGRR
jgi:hypothetical protein